MSGAPRLSIPPKPRINVTRAAASDVYDVTDTSTIDKVSEAGTIKYPIERAASLLDAWLTRVENAARTQLSQSRNQQHGNEQNQQASVPTSSTSTVASSQLSRTIARNLGLSTEMQQTSLNQILEPSPKPLSAQWTAAQPSLEYSSNTLGELVQKTVNSVLDAQSSALFARTTLQAASTQSACAYIDGLHAAYTEVMDEIIRMQPPGVGGLLARLWTSQAALFAGASQIESQSLKAEMESALKTQTEQHNDEVRSIHLQYSDGVSDLLVAADRTAADMRRELALSEANVARLTVELEAMQHRAEEAEARLQFLHTNQQICFSPSLMAFPVDPGKCPFITQKCDVPIVEVVMDSAGVSMADFQDGVVVILNSSASAYSFLQPGKQSPFRGFTLFAPSEIAGYVRQAVLARCRLAPVSLVVPTSTQLRHPISVLWPTQSLAQPEQLGSGDHAPWRLSAIGSSASLVTRGPVACLTLPLFSDSFLQTLIYETFYSPFSLPIHAVSPLITLTSVVPLPQWTGLSSVSRDENCARLPPWHEIDAKILPTVPNLPEPLPVPPMTCPGSPVGIFTPASDLTVRLLPDRSCECVSRSGRLWFCEANSDCALFFEAGAEPLRIALDVAVGIHREPALLIQRVQSGLAKDHQALAAPVPPSATPIQRSLVMEARLPPVPAPGVGLSRIAHSPEYMSLSRSEATQKETSVGRGTVVSPSHDVDGFLVHIKENIREIDDLLLRTSDYDTQDARQMYQEERSSPPVYVRRRIGTTSRSCA